MVTELTQDTWKAGLATGRTVLKVYMNGCPACTDYKPVFEAASKASDIPQQFAELLIGQEPSEFKREHMKSRPGEPLGAPLTYIFENGKELYRASGLLDEEQLRVFIRSGYVIARTKSLKQLTVLELKASLYDLKEELSARR